MDETVGLNQSCSGNMAILDWNVGPTYIMKLLGCQFEQKVVAIALCKRATLTCLVQPSVQQLVKVVTGDFLIRLAEPSVSSHAVALRDFR